MLGSDIIGSGFQLPGGKKYLFTKMKNLWIENKWGRKEAETKKVGLFPAF